MSSERQRDTTPTAEGGESDEDDTDTSERLEQAVAVVSIAFAVLLLSFVLWQGATTQAEATPTATVESIESPPFGDGGPEQTRVAVRLENRGGSGIESATVAVQCGDAGRAIQFTHVPGGGHKTAMVVCPVGTTPTAAVESWTQN